MYGPFFFEDAQTGNACTVTTETYLGILETVTDVDITPDICFKQDGATAHSSVIAKDRLKSKLETRLFRILQTSHGRLGPLTFRLWISSYGVT